MTPNPKAIGAGAEPIDAKSEETGAGAEPIDAKSEEMGAGADSIYATLLAPLGNRVPPAASL